MAQRFGASHPVVVHLVDEARSFAAGVVRHDGANWWWERVDRRADPRIGDDLRRALHDFTAPADLQISGATPEHRQAYRILWERVMTPRECEVAADDADILRQALETGGGELVGFTDRGDTWLVDWETSDGERHSSAIAKEDLTVVGAGICLSGRDREFDLESLVGVVEDRPR